MYSTPCRGYCVSLDSRVYELLLEDTAYGLPEVAGGGKRGHDAQVKIDKKK